MPQFLYFVPSDRPQLSPQDLKACGLGYLGLRANPTAKGTKGPDDKVGLIFDGNGGSASYKPDQQTWQAGPDGKYFVGRVNNEPAPGPVDLQKKRFVAGDTVEMAGERWTIPICLSITRGSTLPRALAIGPDGKTWHLQSLPEFLSLCTAADKVWTAYESALRKAGGQMTGGDKKPDIMTLAEAADYAVQALEVNYRLGHLEVSSLGLLTTETCRDVLDVMVDWRSVVDVAQEPEKKSDTPDTSGTSDGATG